MKEEAKTCVFARINPRNHRVKCGALDKAYCMCEKKKCSFHQTPEERAERDRRYGRAKEDV